MGFSPVRKQTNIALILAIALRQNQCTCQMEHMVQKNLTTTLAKTSPKTLEHLEWPRVAERLAEHCRGPVAAEAAWLYHR